MRTAGAGTVLVMRVPLVGDEKAGHLFPRACPEGTGDRPVWDRQVYVGPLPRALYWARGVKSLGARRSARVEVLRLRVVDHDGVGGLLGVELELLREVDADPLGLAYESTSSSTFCRS